MICKFCGASLPDTAKFCAACGNSLVEITDETSQDAATSENTAQCSVYQESTETGSSYTFSSVKSKKPLLILILGGALALIVIVTVLFFVNKAGFLKTFMGKEDYAKSVLISAIGNVASESDVIETATNSFSSAFASVSGDYDSEEDAYLAMLAMVNSAAGVDGVSVSAGVDIRPSESVYSGFEDIIGDSDVDIDAETLKALVQKLNACTLTATEKTGAEDYQFAMTFGEGKSPIFNVTVFYGADGDIFITFPDATKSALVAEGPELPEIIESEAVAVDMKQLKDLLKQLEEVFDEYYKEADVAVKNSSMKIEDVKLDGLCSEIIFEADTMYDMLSDMIDVVSDNTYLCDLLESNIDGFDYEDDFISELEYSIDGMDESDVEFCFRGYVTPTNKLVGVELSVYNDDNEIRVSALNTSDNFAVGLETEGKQTSDVEMLLVAEKADAKSGTAEFILNDGEDTDVTFNFEYSDLGKHKAFGKETFIGTFKLLIDTDLIESLIGEEIGDEEFEIGNEIFKLESVFENASVVVKVSPDGKGIRYDLAYECDALGYYGAYVAAVPAGKKVASGKFEGDKAIDIDDIAEEEGIEFVEKVAMYYAEKLLEDEVIGAALDDLGLDDADDLIEGVTGGYDIDEYIERNYGQKPVTATPVAMPE